MKCRIVVSLFVIAILYSTTSVIAQPRFPASGRFPIIAPQAGLLVLRGESDTDDAADKGPSEREFLHKFAGATRSILCGDLRAYAFAESQDSVASERDRGLTYNDFWGNWGVSDNRVYTILNVDPTNGKFSYIDNGGESHELGLWARKENRSLWARCLAQQTTPTEN